MEKSHHTVIPMLAWKRTLNDDDDDDRDAIRFQFSPTLEIKKLVLVVKIISRNRSFHSILLYWLMFHKNMKILHEKIIKSMNCIDSLTLHHKTLNCHFNKLKIIRKGLFIPLAKC